MATAEDVCCVPQAVTGERRGVSHPLRTPGQVLLHETFSEWLAPAQSRMFTFAKAPARTWHIYRLAKVAERGLHGSASVTAVCDDKVPQLGLILSVSHKNQILDRRLSRLRSRELVTICGCSGWIDKQDILSRGHHLLESNSPRCEGSNDLSLRIWRSALRIRRVDF